jgi:hypothetical protein
VFLVFSLSANAQTLSGAIDMHAHADPDGVPRKIDAVDLARLAKERGMRAIVLKNHYEPTQTLAYIVRKEVPGIEVFGGISLDLTVGGVNPAAVEWMTKVKGGYGQVSGCRPSTRGPGEIHEAAASVCPVGERRQSPAEVAQVIASPPETIGARNRTLVGSEDLVIIRKPNGKACRTVMITHALTNPWRPAHALRDSTSRKAGRLYRAGLWRAFLRPAAKGQQK